MIIKLYRILEGFLRVVFYGDSKEKIISLCAVNGITLWNSKLRADGIESSISLRNFKNLKRIRPKGVRIHILKKRGIPFVVHRYRYRYGILAGAIIFFAVLQLMSGYIWIIDIKGNNNVSDREIMSALNNIGITEGIAKKRIYPKAEREKLLLQLDKIAWAAINIEGSRLTVNVTEIKEKPKEKNFSNLKALRDGTIEKLDIVSGTSLVKVGDAVKKGDLLVSGIIESEFGTRFVNSKGTVIAKTEREMKLRENYAQNITVPTGKVKSKYALELFGLKIPLYLGCEKGEFNTALRKEDLKLFDNLLPIKIYRKKFTYLKTEKVNFSYEALCERLDKSFEEQTKDLDKFKILKKEFVKDKDGVILLATIETIENIEYEDILLINAGN